jgi:hypothetical protein
MLEFEDVKKCQDAGALNHFIRQYLDERDLQGEERRATYWALFYAWKEGFSGG